MSSWASSERASDELLRAMHAGLPVSLIATDRKDFRTCRRDEALSAVIARDCNSYDHWPIVDEANRIVGLLDLAPLRRHRDAAAVVGDYSGPLDETNLMGADASILSFIRQADRHSCRLLLSGPEISGLVTASDLHKLPVRATLFCIVTNLEITMADAISHEGKTLEEWPLPDSRKVKLMDQITEAKKNNSWVNDLLFTQFCDKVTIIANSSRFVEPRRDFERAMRKIQRLRDNIAHANEYAPDAEAVIQLAKTVELIDSWTRALSSWRTR